jgi:hypothetical protein
MTDAEQQALKRDRAAAFEALWEVAKEYRLEALTPAGTRYAVTGDIIRRMAAEAVAAIRQAER